MKKSKAETAMTRRRIVEIAAQTFKTNGIRATGVAEIMAAAGLTHGGFYRHFASKDQLVAEACAVSMDVLVQAAEAAAAGGDTALWKHLERLISLDFREEYLGGCPLVAMGSELPRAGRQTRRVASQGFREIIRIMATQNRRDGRALPEDDAIFTLSSMIGAVTVARIVDDTEYAKRILEIVRQRLTRRRKNIQRDTRKSKQSERKHVTS